MPTEYLELEDLLALVDDLRVGPVRDVGLLQAAVARPQTSVFGRDAYLSLESKAAALMESLTRNHALDDGNKRLGWLATVVFLGLNGIHLDAPDDDAHDLVIGVSTGAVGVDDVARSLARWAVA